MDAYTMTRIRIADIPDIDELCKLGRELLAQSVYAGIKEDESKFRLFVAGMMGSKTSIVLVVVDEDDKPQGLLLGIIQDLWFSKQRMATDIMFYIREGYRNQAPKIIKRFLAWAESKPRMAQVTLGVSSGIGYPDRIGKMYEHLGMVSVGGIYTKVLKRE